MKYPQLNDQAIDAANSVKRVLHLTKKCRKAIILGTGWHNTLPFDIRTSMSLHELPHFVALPEIKGHERRIGVGAYKGEDIIILSGRIHLNERPHSEDVVAMVRLQIQLLYYLGVRCLISTSAVGSVSNIANGSVGIIKDFMTLYAPTALFGGEFAYPAKALHPRLQGRAMRIGKEILEKGAYKVIHAMVRGPRLESEADQVMLSRSNAEVVGMSQLPDAEIAALYRGFYMLGLCLVTNKSGDTSTHTDNLKRASYYQQQLKSFLTELIPSL